MGRIPFKEVVSQGGSGAGFALTAQGGEIGIGNTMGSSRASPTRDGQTSTPPRHPAGKGAFTDTQGAGNGRARGVTIYRR
jgi:hypothetical protein